MSYQEPQETFGSKGSDMETEQAKIRPLAYMYREAAYCNRHRYLFYTSLMKEIQGKTK